MLCRENFPWIRSAIVLILIGGYWLKLCMSLPDDALVSQYSAPQTIPTILAVCIIFFSVCLLIKNLFFSKGEAEPTEPVNWKDMGRVLALILLAILYVSFIRLVGYLPISVVFLGATLLLFGVRKKLTVLSIMIAVPVILYVVFNLLLKVQLP